MSPSFYKGLAATVSNRLASKDALHQHKQNLIDLICQRFGMLSFADLGGVWAVNGGYTFYALQNYPIEKAVLVDTDFTQSVIEQKSAYPNLRLIEGNFGEDETVAQVGQVDAVLLFDVLLHQVNPDWDRILDLYAPQTRSFAIVNPQFVNAPRTVRLLDLPEDQYFENVPHSRDHEPYKSVFEKMYEIHPQHQRIYRDIHNVWQWGITDDDLVAKMKQLGFNLQFYHSAGKCLGLSNFESHAFAFTR